MVKKKRIFNWELKDRAPTLTHASYNAELLMSAIHAKKARLKKEGRGWSVYIHYERPKIKQWGQGRRR